MLATVNTASEWRERVIVRLRHHEISTVVPKFLLTDVSTSNQPIRLPCMSENDLNEAQLASARKGSLRSYASSLDLHLAR